MKRWCGSDAESHYTINTDVQKKTTLLNRFLSLPQPAQQNLVPQRRYVKVPCGALRGEVAPSQTLAPSPWGNPKYATAPQT